MPKPGWLDSCLIPVKPSLSQAASSQAASPAVLIFTMSASCGVPGPNLRPTLYGGMAHPRTTAYKSVPSDRHLVPRTIAGRCGTERTSVSLCVGEGVAGAQAPQPRSPTQPHLPCPTGGLPRLTATPTRSYVRCSFRGSPTRGSGLSLRAAAAVRGRVQRPRRGWDRWSCWHRASDLQRIPGGKSSAGAAACRRCPRGASSSWRAYAAAHRRRIIRLSPVVFCGGPTLWGIPVGAIGWFRVFSPVRRGGSGAGRCRVRSRPFLVPQPILGPSLPREARRSGGFGRDSIGLRREVPGAVTC